MAHIERYRKKVALYMSVIQACSNNQTIINVRRAIMEGKVRQLYDMLPALDDKTHELFEVLYKEYILICIETRDTIIKFRKLRAQEDDELKLFELFTNAGINLKYILKQIDKYVSRIDKILVEATTQKLKNISL